MRSSEYKEEEIDLTKTLLFIFIGLVVTLVMASSIIIPDIQELKVSKIHSIRNMKQLAATQTYYDKVSAENRRLQEKNRKVIEALQLPMKEPRMTHFGQQKLGSFALGGDSLVPYDANFVRHELNVTSRVDSPIVFYEFIDALASYENLAEVAFPITIYAKEDYSLDVTFGMNVYELSSK